MFSSEIGWQSFCFHRMWIFEKKLLKCAIWYIFCTHSSLEMNFTCSLLTWKQSAMQATVVWGDSQLVPQFDAIQWAQPDLPWHSKKVNLVRAQHMGIGGNVRREWAGRTRKKKNTGKGQGLLKFQKDTYRKDYLHIMEFVLCRLWSSWALEVGMFLLWFLLECKLL